jgi:hypothetical protein
MSRWNVPASTLFILSCLIFIMLLIVVLPAVDLPDTAFHRGTAPLVVHARATTGPTVVAVAALFQLHSSSRISGLSCESGTLAANSSPNFRPILLRSLRR